MLAFVRVSTRTIFWVILYLLVFVALGLLVHTYKRIDSINNDRTRIEHQGINIGVEPALGLHHYSLETSQFDDSELPISCLGQAFDRRVRVYYFEKHSGTLVDLPVRSQMKTKLSPQIYHLPNYKWGPFSLSYDLLVQRFGEELQEVSAWVDVEKIPAGYHYLGKGYFFYGQDPLTPSHNDMVIDFHCHRLDDLTLLIKGPQTNLKLPQIKASFAQSKGLAKNLRAYFEKEKVSQQIFFLFNFVVVALAISRILFFLFPGSVIICSRILRNNFIILAVLLLVMVVPTLPTVEIFYGAFVSFIFGIRALSGRLLARM